MKKTVTTLLLIAGLGCLHHETLAQRPYKDVINSFIDTWEKKALGYSEKAQKNELTYWAFLVVGVIATIVTTLNKKTAAAILTGVVTVLTQVSNYYDIQPQKYRWASQRIIADLERFRESTNDLDLNDPQIGPAVLSQKQALLATFQKIEDEFINLKVASIQVQENKELSGANFSFTRFSPSASLCEEAKLNLSGKRFEASSWIYPLSESLTGLISKDQDNLYLPSIGTGSTLNEANENEKLCTSNNLKNFIYQSSGQVTHLSHQVATDVTSDIQKQLQEVWFKYEERQGVYATCKLYQLPKKLLNSYYTNYNEVKQANTHRQNELFIQKVKAQRIIVKQ